MIKKKYMQPMMRTVQLRNRHQILAGSIYDSIQTTSSGSSDTDAPGYEDTKGNIWEAN